MILSFSRLWEAYKANKAGLKGIVTDENRYKNFIFPTFGGKAPAACFFGGGPLSLSMPLGLVEDAAQGRLAFLVAIEIEVAGHAPTFVALAPQD